MVSSLKGLHPLSTGRAEGLNRLGRGSSCRELEQQVGSLSGERIGLSRFRWECLERFPTPTRRLHIP